MRSWIICLGFCLVYGLSAAKASAQYYVMILPSTGYGNTWLNRAGYPFQVGTGVDSDGYEHALFWDFDGWEPMDLTPPGCIGASLMDISGDLQVGYSTDGYANLIHALLWNWSVGSVVELHPEGAGTSAAFGVYSGEDYNMEVGYIAPDLYVTNRHAALWYGTPESVVDLHPEGYSNSVAYATGSYTQVGWAAAYSDFDYHAMLWYSSPGWYVDLHPTGYDYSEAFDVDEDTYTQVGVAGIGGYRHAMLWNCWAFTAVDLHPYGFLQTQAEAVRNGMQVGWGYDANHRLHALMWQGSAASVVDLNQFLPSGYAQANVYGIDPYGDIVGAAWGSDHHWHPAVWIPW